MKHTHSFTTTHRISAAVLTLAMSLSVGYQVGNAFVEGGRPPMEAYLAAPSVSSSASVSSIFKKKYSTKKVNRSAIRKPRTRTSTGAVTNEVSSKAPNVPIKASCGDKLIIKTLGEECDDGNTANGDGCSSSCKLESGFNCAGTPTECFTICGDSIVTSVEKCDDGNNNGGDGCSGLCKVEFGYTCKGSPSSCEITPYCGDGIKASTEACDDGNSASGDGCYACKVQ